MPHGVSIGLLADRRQKMGGVFRMVSVSNNCWGEVVSVFNMTGVLAELVNELNQSIAIMSFPVLYSQSALECFIFMLKSQKCAPHCS